MVIAVSSHLRFRLLLTGGVWSGTCRLPSISSSARRPRRSVSASTSLTISHPRRRRRSARRMHGATANFARSRLSAFPFFFSCCTSDNIGFSMRATRTFTRLENSYHCSPSRRTRGCLPERKYQFAWHLPTWQPKREANVFREQMFLN